MRYRRPSGVAFDIFQFDLVLCRHFLIISERLVRVLAQFEIKIWYSLLGGVATRGFHYRTFLNRLKSNSIHQTNQFIVVGVDTWSTRPNQN